jgi:very-short-patch-repair endonuclease
MHNTETESLLERRYRMRGLRRRDVLAKRRRNLISRNKSEAQREAVSVQRKKDWASGVYSRELLVKRNKGNRQRQLVSESWTAERRKAESAKTKKRMVAGSRLHDAVSSAASKRMAGLWKTKSWRKKMFRLTGFRTLVDYARSLRVRQTGPEKKLYADLKVIFKSSRIFSQSPFKKAKCIPDFYIPALRLCVFYDSSYWHKGKSEKDLAQTIRLRALGYRVVRIKERSYGRGIGLVKRIGG